MAEINRIVYEIPLEELEEGFLSGGYIEALLIQLLNAIYCTGGVLTNDFVM
jgi:hypothetical protein